MVTQFEGEPIEGALTLAGQLRAAGLRVDVYPDADKLGKQMKYAASRGVKFVTVAGEDERARGEVTVKNLVTGEQSRVALPDVVARLRAEIRPAAGAPPESPDLA
jgi:histidyl-tRNA synthetase